MTAFSIVATVLLGVLSVCFSFDHNACTDWAQSCAYGCSECPDDQTCGCTYFTTHALVHGGWGHGYEGTCATLWSNFKAGKYAGWAHVSNNEADVKEGHAVIMNNGKEGDASHCCVGTGKGLVSCHNAGHKDVPPSSTWYSGGYINAIWGWTGAASENKAVAPMEGNSTTPLTDNIISCGAYQSDACNCVHYARDRQPKLVGGLETCDDKKRLSNSDTAAPGCVIFRTGDPTYCHAAYVTKVSGGVVYYDQSNVSCFIFSTLFLFAVLMIVLYADSNIFDVY